MFNIVRNIFAVLGIVFVVMVTYSTIQSLNQNRRNASAMAFATDSVQVIGTGWNYEEFKKRLHPAFFSGTTEENTRTMFTRLSQLGKLQTIEGCKGQTGESKGQEKNIVAGDFICQGKFEKDTAGIRMTLVQDEASKGWSILGFNVTSNYLNGLK